MIRDDLSTLLVHLTRGESERDAATNFVSILRGQSLRGSDKGIRGKHKVICFSETPIGKLSQVLAHTDAASLIRYAPFGVSVAKKWLFAQGGRPVIYQSEDDFSRLPEDLQWRHVRYEPESSSDYTWEREWRIAHEELMLPHQEVTYVVPTRKWVEYFIENHTNQQRGVVIALGDSVLGASVLKMHPWNFLVLSDLGYQLSWPSPHECGL
jgi:hypothetical protein